jgi:predicted lactoylglutathione lyase
MVKEESQNMENPGILSHISLGTNDFPKARAFYIALLGTIGTKVIIEHDNAIAFGKQFPEFWVQTPIDGEKANIANGVHFGFTARSKAEVRAFWDTALQLGAKPDGEPGSRQEYGEPYFGCFVRDLDGHKIEAVYWDEEKARALRLS